MASTLKPSHLTNLLRLTICLSLAGALSACEKPAGEPCKEKSDCKLGLVCANGVCSHLHRAGESCKKASECIAGLVCLNRECFERRRESSNCDTADQCEEGLTCHGGTCASKKGIERGEKQRKVKTRTALRDIFSKKFADKLDAFGASAFAEDAAWKGGPDGAKAGRHFDACVPAFTVVVDAIKTGEFDDVPAQIAAAGAHVAPMLSAAAAAHPRLTAEMKAAMTNHEDAIFGRKQRQQKANRKLIHQLKELAKATTAGMQACLQAGPPEARVAALKYGVALRDSSREGAEGKMAKAFARGISKLASQTASREPYKAIRAQMKEIVSGVGKAEAPAAKE